MARVRASQRQSDPPASEGPADTWERINALMERTGVTVTELAKAAGVTWAAAKRWTQAPKPHGPGARPSGENLAAIARRLGVTVEDLLRQWDGEEPDHPSWTEFKATRAYAQLTDNERHNVMLTRFAPGQPPTLAAWLAAAEVQFASRPRVAS